MAIAGYQVIPDDAWWESCWQVAIGYAGTAAILIEDVLGRLDLPTPSDPFFLMLYPACALGLALLIRRRDARHNWTGLGD